MHVGIFSSQLGTRGGPVIVDNRVFEEISKLDNKNHYTVYGVTPQSTKDIRLHNGNFTIKMLKPSGKLPAVAFGLTLELLRRPVDILHATLVSPLIVPGKFIITITCWSQDSAENFYPPLIRWRLRHLISKGIRNATAIFCYTHYLKNRVIEQFNIHPDRIFITKPGIGEEMKPLNDKESLSTFLKDIGIDGPFILFIGSLTKRKNVEGLVRAYHMLVKEAKIEHKLVLLGERIFFSDSILKAIQELDLGGRVILIDRRPHHELPLFYNGADVLVLPTFSEGFGMPPLEAMACGTPVVASNVSSVPEVVGDAAVMIDPYQPEDIADGILRCLTDNRLRQGLIEKGLARAREFSWQKAALQTIDGYEKACQL